MQLPCVLSGFCQGFLTIVTLSNDMHTYMHIHMCTYLLFTGLFGILVGFGFFPWPAFCCCKVLGLKHRGPTL